MGKDRHDPSKQIGGDSQTSDQDLEKPGMQVSDFILRNGHVYSTQFRKTPVFVKSMEQAVELSEVFAKEKSVVPRISCAISKFISFEGCAQYSS